MDSKTFHTGIDKDGRPVPHGGYRENQVSIALWAGQTFGEAGSNARVAARSNEEMAELLRKLTVDDAHSEAPEEIADVVIVLFRLAERMGVDLLAEIDAKMKINRARVWRTDGSGHGYHVREKTDGR